MFFQRVDEPHRKTSKLQGEGDIYYSVWYDEQNLEYVRIEENIGGGPDNGTFPDDVFRLDDISYKRAFTAYNVSDGPQKTLTNKNLSGFLRAIKNDLLKERKKASNGR